MYLDYDKRNKELEEEKIIQQLEQRYYELYPTMPKLPIRIIITDCLSESHYEIRPEQKERLISEGVEKFNDQNGRMILPDTIGKAINILLNRESIIKYTDDESMTWVGAYAHELTHAIDYHCMAAKEKLNSYDPLLEVSEYQMFQLWSEYHAKKVGYSFLRDQMKADTELFTERERIEHIADYEYPAQFERHHAEYHKTNDGNYQMYITMHLLGRYSVWCDLYPSAFSESAFKEIPWMQSIYNFLRRHESLDAVYPHFEDMRLILKENWRGL